MLACHRIWIVLACLGSMMLVASGSAAERTAAEFLPRTTGFYAESTGTKDLLAFVLDHPLTRQVLATEEYRRATATKEFLAFKLGVGLIEQDLGMSWRQILEELTAGGVYAAIDAPTKGATILAKASRPELSEKIVAAVASVAQLDAQKNQRDNPIKTGEYRGIKGYQLGELRVAVVNSWLMAANKSDLLQVMIDRALDGGGDHLGTNEAFSKAYGERSQEAKAWSFLDVKALREGPPGANLMRGPVDNPVAELLLGGIVANLQHTPYVTTDLSLRDGNLRVAATSPHQAEWVGEAREYYFGPEGKGTAPPLLVGDRTILSLATYRDVAGMWLRAGDLFNAQVNDGFAKADSQLTTLFSGKDFGEDILGAMRPELQVLVVRQDFSKAGVVPAIKLPAFCLAFELRDPEKMQPELRRVFQSLVGFLNIVGAMNGQPQLELDIDKSNQIQIYSSKYLVEPSAVDGKPVPIQHNFSPSLAFVGKRGVVSSTRDLARSVAEQLQKEQVATPANGRTNTELAVRTDALRDLLQDNRGQLVSQNMVEKGHSKEAAEHEIGLLLSLMEFVQGMRLQLQTDSSSLRLVLEAESQRAKP